MNLWNRLRAWLRAMFQRSSMESEMDAELRFHLEAYAEDLIQSGVKRTEAERRARIEFGGVERTKEECRDARGLRFVDGLIQDLRFGARMLAKDFGFTAVAVLTLALGIGANTAIFSMIDAVMLRSLPVHDPERLVVFNWRAHSNPKYHGYSNFGDCGPGGGGAGCSFSHPFFDRMHKEQTVFSGVTAFAGPMQFDIGGNGHASIGHAELVSGDFFKTLGVRTVLGRPLGPEDDAAAAPPVIVLSYRYWKSAFNGDPTVIGRAIRLNGAPCTIAGVADSSFTNLAPGKTQDFFLPLRSAAQMNIRWLGNPAALADPQIWWVVIMGRLKEGVSIGQAQAAATTIFSNEMLHGAKPLSKPEDAPAILLAAAPQGLSGGRGRYSSLLYVSMAAAGFVLLIACANLAGLALARSGARRKEIAVRLVLGGGRWRIARQLLTECVLLSVAGGALGVLLAEWGVKAFCALLSNGAEQPFPFVVSPNWRVLLFALGTSVLTGLFFGVAPALRDTRVDLTPALKENAATLPGIVGRGGRKFHLGGALVVAQVALSIVVLVGAGLLVRTLHNLRSVAPGFDTRNVLLFGLDPSLLGYKDERTQNLYRELQERFAGLPGVTSASYASVPFLNGSLWSTDLHLPGQPEKSNVETDTLAVGPEFFATLRIPLVAGRTFTAADFASAHRTWAAEQAASEAMASGTRAAAAKKQPAAGAPIPILVNETFARNYFENRDPVGQHVEDSVGDDETPAGKSAGYQIIGVVGNTKYSDLRREIQPAMFQPFTHGGAHFELRTAVAPDGLIPAVRDVVNSVDNNLPVFDVHTQSERIEELMVQKRIIARLSSFFGLLALLLACIGLYGLLSSEVARRTREIGIRVALGAQQRNVAGLVIGQGTALVIVGVMLGIGAGYGVTRYLKSLLYEVRPVDPLTYAAVVILLFVVALLACYIPVRRAMRVDPMVALRYE